MTQHRTYKTDAKPHGLPSESEKVKPKQRHRRVNPKKMARFMAVVAVEGYAPVGKIEVDLTKCAIYRLEASE